MNSYDRMRRAERIMGVTPSAGRPDDNVRVRDSVARQIEKQREKHAAQLRTLCEAADSGHDVRREIEAIDEALALDDNDYFATFVNPKIVQRVERDSDGALSRAQGVEQHRQASQDLADNFDGFLERTIGTANDRTRRHLADGIRNARTVDDALAVAAEVDVDKFLDAVQAGRVSDAEFRAVGLAQQRREREAVQREADDYHADHSGASDDDVNNAVALMEHINANNDEADPERPFRDVPDEELKRLVRQLEG